MSCLSCRVPKRDDSFEAGAQVLPKGATDMAAAKKPAAKKTEVKKAAPAAKSAKAKTAKK